jgi:hypothetical protein
MAAPSALDSAAGLDLDRSALAPDTAAHVPDIGALALDMAVAVFLDIAAEPGWDRAVALDSDIAAHAYSVVVATVAACSVAAAESNGAVERDADYSASARADWRWAGRGEPLTQRSQPPRATSSQNPCS